MSMLKAQWCWLVAAFVALPFSPAGAQFIDFETLPGGAGTVDQQTISDEYLSLGVTFSLLDPVTGTLIGSPRIAKAGLPQTAFEGCISPDTPLPHLGLGQSYLTDGTAIGLEGNVRIEYTTPVAQASGVIIDIDCRTNGAPPCEQWTIVSYDTNGAPIDSVVLDAPSVGPNPACINPDAGFGDSNGFGWQFQFGSPVIKSIILKYTGAASGPGLAFDSFSVSSVPVALDATTAASADSICRGETITLSAFPSGGLPPYMFQWQQEVGPSYWIDLGTGDTESVRPSNTQGYRAIVTDADGNIAISATRVVDVIVDDTLCEAALLVSSNTNNRIVRYSFLSGQGEVFVPSGSGGLNGPSKLICGPDANIYVSSQNDDRVRRYDGVTGEFIDVFVAAGSGGLNVPVGLDFGPDGHLYVASYGNHSVLRYDGTTGAFIDTFIPNGSGLNGPTGLLWGADDHLYVCSWFGDKVLHFDGSGVALGDFVTAGSGGLDAPRGLTFGPDGNLYVGEQYNNSVRRYDGMTGAFIDVFVATGSGGLDRANDVAFGPDGILYVPSFDNNKILGYEAATGTYAGELPNDLVSGPAWVAVGCVPWPTPVHESPPPRRATIEIDPSVPNPFNPWTRIAFTLPSRGRTRVTIIDVAGRVVATLLDQDLPGGRRTVEWDGRNAAGQASPSGIYFVRVESKGLYAARKIALIR